MAVVHLSSSFQSGVRTPQGVHKTIHWGAKIINKIPLINKIKPKNSVYLIFISCFFNLFCVSFVMYIVH